MKKEYFMPQCEVFKVYTDKLLDDTSTTEVPGGGSGNPDSRRYDSTWDE